jgi:hypothetical protein
LLESNTGQGEVNRLIRKTWWTRKDPNLDTAVGPQAFGESVVSKKQGAG